MTREKLLRSSEYHIGALQCDLYCLVDNFKRERKLSTKQLAEELKLSLSKTREILSGDFNGSIESFINICFSINKVPVISFIDLDEYLEKDKSK